MSWEDVLLVSCVQAHCLMLNLAEYEEFVHYVLMEKQLLVLPARMSAGFTYACLALCHFV